MTEIRWIRDIGYWRLDHTLSWLRSGNNDPRWWNLKRRLIKLCLSELQALLKTKTKALSICSPMDPTVEVAVNVIPHLESMLAAMNGQNREAALAEGTAAMEILSAAVRKQEQLSDHIEVFSRTDPKVSVGLWSAADQRFDFVKR